MKSAKSKTTKPSVASILREYGLPESMVKAGKHGLRYRNPLEKGIYWYWFAKVRVLEDFLEYGGRCVSCNRVKELSELQGGHFVPAGKCGFALLFHPENVNAECAGCNGFDEMHLRGYEKHLDNRYGPGTGEKLVQLKNRVTMKEWSALEYVPRIAELRERYAQLQECMRG